MSRWEELLAYNFECPPKSQFKRKKEIEDEYKFHLDSLKKKNIRVSDYIQKIAFPDNESYKFLKNEFPYDLEDGIDHWLLWLNPIYSIEDTYIKELVEHRMGSEVVYFCNYKFNQSIPTIRHCHIFVKK